MILYPSIDRLIELADSKYTLVIAASKRARLLQEGARARVADSYGKTVSIALRELEAGRIRCVRTGEGVI
jgi:DNA-directed RNA polymerase subunit omega